MLGSVYSKVMGTQQRDRVFTLTTPGDFDLSIDELWPDGDAPENPTAEDVKGLIEKCGGILQIIRDWDLLSRSDYEVRETTLSPEARAKLERAMGLAQQQELRLDR
jgi:hypothetical protein